MDENMELYNIAFSLDTDTIFLDLLEYLELVYPSEFS